MSALGAKNNGMMQRSPAASPRWYSLSEIEERPPPGRETATRESLALRRHACAHLTLTRHPTVIVPAVASYVTGYDVRLLVRSPPIHCPALLNVAP